MAETVSHGKVEDGSLAGWAAAERMSRRTNLDGNDGVAPGTTTQGDVPHHG